MRDTVEINGKNYIEVPYKCKNNVFTVQGNRYKKSYDTSCYECCFWDSVKKDCVEPQELKTISCNTSVWKKVGACNKTFKRDSKGKFCK